MENKKNIYRTKKEHLKFFRDSVVQSKKIKNKKVKPEFFELLKKIENSKVA